MRRIRFGYMYFKSVSILFIGYDVYSTVELRVLLEHRCQFRQMLAAYVDLMKAFCFAQGTLGSLATQQNSCKDCWSTEYFVLGD